MSLPKLRPVRLRSATSIDSHQDLLAISVSEDCLKNNQISNSNLQKLDQQLGGIVTELVALGDFEGKWLQTTSSLTKAASPKRVLLIGTGRKTNHLAERAREIGLKIADAASKMKIKKLAYAASPGSYATCSQVVQTAHGMRMGLYTYPLSSASPVDGKNETPVEVSLLSDDPQMQKELARADSIAHNIENMRLLQDGPPNEIHPENASKIVSELASKLGLKSTIWGKKELTEKGFNAMLAVSSASSYEPQLVTIEYTPEKYTKTIALVGKGLTMDTGGYSIKTPNEVQLGMKYDMSGAALALCACMAAAELKLPVRVIAVGAFCENMIDAKGYRLGDVLKTYSGKTLEILNTDAEGRVVLCDALSYVAKDLKPDCILEFSTLTGAIIRALGQVSAGVFAFNDDNLGNAIMNAANETGERCWLMPQWEEILDSLKGSPCADLTNVSQNSIQGGAITGGVFLNEFVEGRPFAHIDIAGVANANMAFGYPKKISSGFGIQLAVRLLETLSK